MAEDIEKLIRISSTHYHAYTVPSRKLVLFFTVFLFLINHFQLCAKIFCGPQYLYLWNLIDIDKVYYILDIYV